MKIDLEALTIRDANLYIIQYTKYCVLIGVTCQACLFIFLRLHKLHGWQKKETNICHKANISKAFVVFAISFSDRLSKKHSCSGLLVLLGQRIRGGGTYGE